MEILNIKIELFREAIRRRRIELGLTQKELGKKVGLSASTISKIELGKTEAPYSKIDVFAAALKTTPSKLISIAEKNGILIEGEIIETE